MEEWTTEDETVEWHHQLDGCEFEQAPAVGEGQESLACCSAWDGKEYSMMHVAFLESTPLPDSARIFTLAGPGPHLMSF